MTISLRADHDPTNMSLRLHTCGGTNGCITCDTIERVSEYRYLGVIFDNRLKWTGHVTYIRNKLRKFIFIFSNLNKILPLDLIKIVYYAYVQSLLQYGILAWGGGFRSLILPLEIIQKSILKSALNKSRRYPTDLLFDEFEVFNIPQLYVKSLILYIFKTNYHLFQPISHSYSTRSATNSGIVPPRLTRTINSTSSHYLANIIYPSLPNIIKHPQTRNITTFKKIVNKWIVDTGREGIRSLLVSLYV